MDAKVTVIGDGPAGLSAALLLAKAGYAVIVLGSGETGVRSALLQNYLGVAEKLGTDFYETALAQVRGYGADVRPDVAISAAMREGISVTTSAGDVLRSQYLILAEGKRRTIARQLGLVESDDLILVDSEFRTRFDHVYVVGRSLRPRRSQAIISAGAGATAALDILSREAGIDVHDWDVPPAS